MMSMLKSIVISAILYGLCLVHGKKTTHEHFCSALGASNVNMLYDSDDSLQGAIEHGSRGLKLMSAGEVKHGLTCGSYEAGQEIAEKFFDNKDVRLSPILVDKLDDAICFTVASAEQVKEYISSVMDIMVEMPNSFKIGADVFDLVDSLMYGGGAIRVDEIFGEKALDFEMGFIFNIPTQMVRNASDHSAVDHAITDIFNILGTYEKNVLADFFHPSTTAPDSGSGFVFAGGKRREQWKYLSNILMAAVGESEDGDPCGFHDIEVTYMDDEAIVALRSIIVSNIPERAAACVAYIAARVASYNIVDVVQISKRIELLNHRARSITQSGVPGSQESFTPYTSAGLTGSGQVVAVSDTGLDEYSCYFKDSSGLVPRSLVGGPIVDNNKRKLIMYSRLAYTDGTDMTDGHGTHVCGTVAGNNGEHLSYGGRSGGVAPDAKLVFLDIGTPTGTVYGPSVADLYVHLGKAGARIFTNSWGAPFTSNKYYYDRRVDQFLYDNTDFLILFAAGNWGTYGAEWVTRECSSKNVVAVGASETTLYSKSEKNIAYFSSYGPAYDGRIKPDIIAPGGAVESARAEGSPSSSCKTSIKSGTSMASPAAAGAAALIRQYFMDGKFWASHCYQGMDFCGPFTPSGVLLKAVMMHSGKSLETFTGAGSIPDYKLGSVPDTRQGFGLITLSNVLPLNTVYSFDLYVRDLRVIRPHSTDKYIISVKDNRQPIKFTLTWYDPPAADGAAKALVHDLNLRVISPRAARKVYLGNGKIHEFDQPTRYEYYDHVNTVEQIEVTHPRRGWWKVFISADALPYGGQQKYSLVVSYRGLPITVHEPLNYGKGTDVLSMDIDDDEEDMDEENPPAGTSDAQTSLSSPRQAL